MPCSVRDSARLRASRALTFRVELAHGRALLLLRASLGHRVVVVLVVLVVFVVVFVLGRRVAAFRRASERAVAHDPEQHEHGSDRVQRGTPGVRLRAFFGGSRRRRRLSARSRSHGPELGRERLRNLAEMQRIPRSKRRRPRRPGRRVDSARSPARTRSHANGVRDHARRRSAPRQSDGSFRGCRRASRSRGTCRSRRPEGKSREWMRAVRGRT